MHRHRTTIGGIGLVLSGVALGLSYREPSQTQDGEHAIKSWSFGASVVAAIGEVGEFSSRLTAITAWGSSAATLADRLSRGRFTNLVELTSGVGKLLGVTAGVVTELLQMWEGYDAYQAGDVVFGVGFLFIGLASMALFVAVWLSLIPAGVGLIVAINLVAAGYAISLFKHDDLQRWLDACYFGKHNLTQKQFTGLGEQRAAYMTLINER